MNSMVALKPRRAIQLRCSKTSANATPMKLDSLPRRNPRSYNQWTASRFGRVACCVASPGFSIENHIRTDKASAKARTRALADLMSVAPSTQRVLSSDCFMKTCRILIESLGRVRPPKRAAIRVCQKLVLSFRQKLVRVDCSLACRPRACSLRRERTNRGWSKRRLLLQWRSLCWRA